MHNGDRVVRNSINGGCYFRNDPRLLTSTEPSGSLVKGTRPRKCAWRAPACLTILFSISPALASWVFIVWREKQTRAGRRSWRKSQGHTFTTSQEKRKFYLEKREFYLERVPTILTNVLGLYSSFCTEKQTSNSILLLQFTVILY